MIFAIDWVMYNQKDSLMPQVTAAIDKAMVWEAQHIGPNGAVSIVGNTRTHGQEVNRDGSTKKLIYHDVIRPLGEWALLRDSPYLLKTAKLVAAYKQQNPGA